MALPVHLGQELLAFGLLFGSSLLAVGETQLFTDKNHSWPAITLTLWRNQACVPRASCGLLTQGFCATFQIVTNLV